MNLFGKNCTIAQRLLDSESAAFGSPRGQIKAKAASSTRVVSRTLVSCDSLLAETRSLRIYKVDWLEHSHDLCHLIDLKGANMPGPIVGIGHSMGGTQLCVLPTTTNPESISLTKFCMTAVHTYLFCNLTSCTRLSSSSQASTRPPPHQLCNRELPAAHNSRSTLLIHGLPSKLHRNIPRATPYSKHGTPVS